MNIMRQRRREQQAQLREPGPQEQCARRRECHDNEQRVHGVKRASVRPSRAEVPVLLAASLIS
jgi:hypothetical protein